MISVFFVIILLNFSYYLSSSWRIINIKKMKHFMNMMFKRFKISISILNQFVLRFNATKSSHSEIKKQRVLNSNHSSLFHRRSLRQRKMNQNLFSLKRNRSQITKRNWIQTFSIQHLVRVRLTFVLKRKLDITRNRVIQKTRIDFRKFYFSQIFITIRWFKQCTIRIVQKIRRF